MKNILANSFINSISEERGMRFICVLYYFYILLNVAGSNVHVIIIIEYVDKQEIYMTAKEMERLDEIGMEYFRHHLQILH